MNVNITPVNIGGYVKAIASKSYAHRSLICASLCEKSTKIYCENISEDIVATVRCLVAMGAYITREENYYIVEPIQKIKANAELDCGESGSTLRFLIPVVCALGINAKFVMSGRLPERPLDVLLDELKQHNCCFKKYDNFLECSGKLSGGKFTITGDISSQFISGLLFALPLIDEPSSITITNKFESKGYVDLTRCVQELFGVKVQFEDSCFLISSQSYNSPSDLIVEGDWSNSAFWLCAGAISNKSVKVTNLNFNSLQGDKKILQTLKQFGANVTLENNSAIVLKADLTGIEVDASEIPDLVPIIAVVGSVANGKTVIKNAQRLRIKESDRLKTVACLINSLGGSAVETDDGLIITGKNELNGGTIDAFGDHRIAMSAAILSIMCSNNVVIKGAQAVNKSYPSFFKDFEMLGGNYNLEE